MGRKSSLKAQAALDFMMTYGWALLLMALVAAALAALGIFDPGTFIGSRATGFSQVAATAWQLDSSTGELQLRLKNNAGTEINITTVNATLLTISNSTSGNLNIKNGEQQVVAIVFSPMPLSKGSSYSIKIKMNYTDTESGLNYSDSGTVTGRAN